MIRRLSSKIMTEKTSLEINGAPVHIISKLRGYGGYRGTQIAEMDVSLRRDENGRETLSIFFQAGQHELVVPEGGSVELTLTTKNIAQRYENTSYYNVCYLTPTNSSLTKTM